MRKSYFPNVDFIPACLALYEAEIAIVMRVAASSHADQAVEFFNELKFGIQTVSDQYDLILIDSPPALGMISINVLLAADALLVPSAARMFDFSSTVQFFRMIHDYIGQIDPIQELPLDLGADDALRSPLREPEAVLRGDAGLLRGFGIPAGLLPFKRRHQFCSPIHHAV